MGRRATADTVVDVDNNTETNGDALAEPRGPLTSAQRIAASTAASNEVTDPYAAEAKYFTEIRTLNRDVNSL